jgi:hypothetical protein
MPKESRTLQALPYAEYEKLSLEQKIAYLKMAFRQTQEPDRAVSAEAAAQSASAESKI